MSQIETGLGEMCWLYLFYYLPFVFSTVFVTFPVMACLLCSVWTLVFLCCFLQPSHISLSALFPWSVSNLDNAFSHNLYNPPPVSMMLLKRTFLLVLPYLSLDACLNLFPILIFVFAHKQARMTLHWRKLDLTLECRSQKQAAWKN